MNFIKVALKLLSVSDVKIIKFTNSVHLCLLENLIKINLKLKFKK